MVETRWPLPRPFIAETRLGHADDRSPHKWKEGGGYPTRQDAEQDSLPTTLRKLAASKPNRRRTSSTTQFKRKLVFVKKFVEELEALGSSLSPDEMAEVGSTIKNDLAATRHVLTTLTLRIGEPKAELVG